jgi:hypothetical protein
MTFSLARFARVGTRIGALLATLAILAFPAAAAAQTVQDAYSSPAGNIQAEVNTADQSPGGNVTQTTTRSDGDGALPFTGLDLAFLLLGGAGLLVVGLALRRVTQHEELGQ